MDYYKLNISKHRQLLSVFIFIIFSWSIGVASDAHMAKGLKGKTSVMAAFVVTNTNDSGPGSLRQALIDANALGVLTILLLTFQDLVPIQSALIPPSYYYRSHNH